MTPEQRTRFTQGIVFGVFFQYLGYFIKDVATKGTAPYIGGIAGMVMGLVIFAWGCTHLVAARHLPRWANALGLLSLLGLAMLWWWPVKAQDARAGES